MLVESDALKAVEIVLRALGGEDLETLSRKNHIPVEVLQSWKTEFVQGGSEVLKKIFNQGDLSSLSDEETRLDLDLELELELERDTDEMDEVTVDEPSEPIDFVEPLLASVPVRQPEEEDTAEDLIEGGPTSIAESVEANAPKTDLEWYLDPTLPSKEAQPQFGDGDTESWLNGETSGRELDWGDDAAARRLIMTRDRPIQSEPPSAALEVRETASEPPQPPELPVAAVSTPPPKRRSLWTLFTVFVSTSSLVALGVAIWLGASHTSVEPLGPLVAVEPARQVVLRLSPQDAKGSFYYNESYVGSGSSLRLDGVDADRPAKIRVTSEAHETRTFVYDSGSLVPSELLIELESRQ